jgi:hypothetical protein
MAINSGGQLFWTTLATAPALLALATLIGRAWTRLLPWRLGAPARMYLAPALGIATLTILASLLGRQFPLGDTVLLPWSLALILAMALLLEPRPVVAMRQAIIVATFGLVCGVTLLVPLYIFGGFNSHNDAFTYLIHSAWLQEHSFSDKVSFRSPGDLQVAMYQEHGLRMGASFLLALTQTVANLRWAYQVYPAVMIACLGACCLATGYPLLRVMRPLGRPARLALLALPAFSLGGLVFGANNGFLPQTLGLTLAAAALFLLGPLLEWLGGASGRRVRLSALPVALLLAASVYAYSELAPFVAMAVVTATVVAAVRQPGRRRIILFAALVSGLSVLLLNAELLRAVAALREQSGVVVGGPVDWPLQGFLAYAMGVHGGAWSPMQWSSPGHPWTFGALTLAGIGILLAVLVILRGRTIWQTVIRGPLLPVAAMLLSLLGGFIYFRYFVQSPFATGVGQSWSQFKLVDWAHPFLAVILIMAVVLSWRYGRRSFGRALAVLVGGAAIAGGWFGTATMASVAGQYPGAVDLGRSYLEFRQALDNTCPPGAPVYLALPGKYHKLRQMALIFLPDRDVRADWTDDGYFAQLDSKKAKQLPEAGDCLVEPAAEASGASVGVVSAPFHIGRIDRNGWIRLAAVTGAFGRESDGKNWWHWVNRGVSFALEPILVDKKLSRVRLTFLYGTRGKQVLTIRLATRSGAVQVMKVDSPGQVKGTFDQVFDLPVAELTELSIDSDGQASPLGERDARTAAWIVRNVVLVPEASEDK